MTEVPAQLLPTVKSTGTQVSHLEVPRELGVFTSSPKAKRVNSPCVRLISSQVRPLLLGFSMYFQGCSDSCHRPQTIHFPSNAIAQQPADLSMHFGNCSFCSFLSWGWNLDIQQPGGGPAMVLPPQQNFASLQNDCFNSLGLRTCRDLPRGGGHHQQEERSQPSGSRKDFPCVESGDFKIQNSWKWLLFNLQRSSYTELSSFWLG